MRRRASTIVAAMLVTACTPAANQSAGSGTAAPNTSASNASASSMTFFVTSAGSGNGANLGGLAGADKHCQDLAQAAGAGGHTWHAYLSTTASGTAQATNARDRIGAGPWRNSKGDVIAQSVDDLHSANNKLTKQTALTEKGTMIPGRGDSVNQHDILTGSSSDGRTVAGSDDTTCSNWTSSDQGAAIVGHHDRMGLRDDEPSKSWNSSHPSRGCSQANLVGTGGNGLFYCFAVN
jgi:hypothetical protein